MFVENLKRTHESNCNRISMKRPCLTNPISALAIENSIDNANNPWHQQQQRIDTLPIDTCEKTFDLESQFVSRYEPKKYTFNLDSMTSVVLSRSLGTSYSWPQNQPLTINDLSYFAENGHTLGIDYTQTFCRMFALDIDCICRKTGTTFDHLNENIINLIIDKLMSIFISIFNIDNPIISVWRNKCGFHLYTDIPVTMPTHLFLKKQLESCNELLNQPCVIEVPSIMPLPYSAKIAGEPYKPVNSNLELNFIPLTIHQEGQSFIDLFSFQTLELDGRTIAKISSIIGDTFLVKLNKHHMRRSNPRFVNVSMIYLNPAFEYMAQFKDYIMKMVECYNESMTKIQNVDLSEFSVDERKQIRCFMAKVNSLFGINGSESCSMFINLAALEYGGLYMQPFCASLFLNLHISDLFTDFERFRLLLRHIFHSITIQYKSIEQFINLVNIQTFQAYSDEGWLSIINHLHFLISYDTNPMQTLNEQINRIMEKMTDSTAEQISQLIFKECQSKDKSRAELSLMELMDKFKVIFHEMKLMYYDQASSRYYYLNPSNSASYESTAKLSDDLYPSVMRQWMGYTQLATTHLKNRMERSREMLLCEPIKFSQTEYMYSTQVGVFNSAVGMYTAHTRFLRFNKYRHISIWPYNEPEKIFFGQNESVIAHYEVVSSLLSNIHTKLFELYIHSVFAPAIIQLRNLMMIEERFISQIFILLANHHKADNFDAAKFLIGYYQFDPKIVYLIIHLCNEYGGLEIFYSYNILCSKIFHTEYVSPIIWSEKFHSIMANAKYDNTLPTYIQRLESLHGENIENVNTATYLSVIIILACIIKCDSFVDFVRAFNITLPETFTPHPLYTENEIKTNVQTMKTNITRARHIVFGETLTPFQHTLIDELFSICMSADFKPETILNYLTAVGSMFIPINILKKLLLIHGGQDVGKSLACKKITAIAQPSACRFDDISAVMTRASVAEYSAIILNEAKSLNSSQLKIVTGNDDTSAMKFYSQKYELQQMQTHMFGATNIHITFKGHEDVDKTSVSRLYAIMFTGINTPAESKHSSLLAMMVSGRYFAGILSPIFAKSVDALRWLSFGVYMMGRDLNYFPKLDLNCDTCREYQHTVYYTNSSLYKFLVDAGIVDAPGFTLSMKSLSDIANQNLDKNGKYSSLALFRADFEKQFNVSFNKTKFVNDFQQVGLIQHIMDNMMVIEEEGAIITPEDIKARLNKYNLPEHRDNALSYFQRTQEAHYDYKRQVYTNIAFSSDLGDAYEGNEANSSMTDMLSIERDSLVMKSI